LLTAVLVAVVAQAGFYDDTSAVKSFTNENFNEVLQDKENAWIIEFYAPWCGHCKKLTPEWEGAATQLAKDEVKGIKLGAVDADEHKELGQQFDVSGFPTIKIFGFNKEEPKEYEGGRQQGDILHIAKWQGEMMVASATKGEQVEIEAPKKEQVSNGFYDDSEVVDLYDDNFETEVLKGSAPWLVEFYAPWCGHCKQLTPVWKELAGEMSGQMKIGACDVTAAEKVGKMYNIQGFPTLKFFAPGAESPEDYSAGRDLGSLKEFCEKKAEDYPMKAVEVEQLKDQTDLTENCMSKTLCVTFVLPHVMDTGVAGRKSYLETLNKVGKKFSPKKVGLNWVQGGDHYDYEEEFGISANYPTYVAVGAKKMLFAKLQGKFDAPSIIANLQKLMGPRGAGFYKLAKIPELEKGVELWDGKEYVAPSEDE